ncbi:2Fe-2S iron-sulfur cluster binding domain-containing protein [Acidimangrovimonas sediminis]|uniref:2Fe-2S iron-sulfur cluster binding domain-containing protein n=1 Tax=Acidimangrovimonas sediminis TaxID=2056283 RepID=UPI000C7FEC42|nr:2Fe-2S iron-sulfur cluster binding domain-containing protein [Acidimangrovimonas sediminis]
MTKTFTVTVGDRSFHARAGDRLLDAALRNGVDLLHDCRAGHCGACVVEVLRGVTLGGESGPGNVKACQARIFSQIRIAAHDAPHPNRRRATVDAVRTLVPGVVEVTLRLRRPLAWRPGQFVKLQFRGHPPRSFSPTATLAGGEFASDRLVFHIKQVRDGRVTPRLGAEIGAGAPVTVEGPFGHAYLRDDRPGRIVALGSGTGFAPAWAIAAAALAADPQRHVVLGCGARRAAGFYMGPALRLAARYPNVDLRVCLEETPPGVAGILGGTPADHLADLGPEDTVFAAGGPSMVARAEHLAGCAGARFYADPFAPDPKPANGTLTAADLQRAAQRLALRRLTGFLGRARRTA